ncbi:MAG: DUF1697 domain-containing protein [Bacteroidetes bacterium]|nr:DUF1697 domain-containing protein [Bacteroidota bacterium]
MEKYIALLRGINVGGHKKILMTDLRSLFISLGFKEVVTYIQSGNVVFSTSEKDDLAIKISEGIKSKYGWDVPVLIKTASEMESVLSNCPFSEEKKEKSYFTLFNETPSEKNIEEVAQLSYPNEEFVITPMCLYFFCATGYGRTKMNVNFVERKLKVTATTRNFRTLVKLLELATRE